MGGLRQEEDRDAVRRRYQRADPGSEGDQHEDVPDAFEVDAKPDPPKQARACDGLERVADGDGGCDGRLRATRRVGDQGTERDGRPVAATKEQERRERDAARRPDRRDDAVGDREIDPELRGSDIRAGDGGKPEPVAGLSNGEASPSCRNQATPRGLRLRPSHLTLLRHVHRFT